MEPKINIITLGVNDLERSFAFYKNGLGLPSEGYTGEGDSKIAFFKLDGVMLGLYPRKHLAKDGNIPNDGKGWPGFSIGHFVKSKKEVDQIIKAAVAAGATIPEAAQERVWGGYSGYFRDPDGFCWEIVFFNNP